ncbi:MAG: ThuA domain-containing protein [Protaetiibacter sp.]
MARALILAGGGDYTDPWHPFAATAERLREVLEAEGMAAMKVDTVAALSAAIGAAELLVLNAGSGDETTPHDAALLALVDAHLRAGRPLLAVHAAAGLVPESDAWERLLGGRWVRGVSWHPELDEARVDLAPHAIPTGLDAVTVVDERYTALRLTAGPTVFAWHEEGGVRHPLAWTHAVHGARVVYDALGHDTRSYDSPGRRALLAREVRWLVAH